VRRGWNGISYIFSALGSVTAIGLKALLFFAFEGRRVIAYPFPRLFFPGDVEEIKELSIFIGFGIII
jgi:hypothetical protein